MELKIAQIQMPVTADKEANIRRACDMVRQAGNVDMAVLPEMFCCPYDNACFRPYGEEEGGHVWRALSALAKERGIWLVGGTVPELAEGRVYNTCYVFAPDGQMAAKHRKMHLFDIAVAGGQRFMESETLTAGDSVTTFDTPWGTVVHQCDEMPQIAVTTLDMERVEAIRQQLPVLSARRTDVYELRRR